MLNEDKKSPKFATLRKVPSVFFNMNQPHKHTVYISHCRKFNRLQKSEVLLSLLFFSLLLVYSFPTGVLQFLPGIWTTRDEEKGPQMLYWSPEVSTQDLGHRYHRCCTGVLGFLHRIWATRDVERDPQMLYRI